MAPKRRPQRHNTTLEMDIALSGSFCYSPLVSLSALDGGDCTAAFYHNHPIVTMSTDSVEAEPTHMLCCAS
eukprot:scaffold33422_cov67-Skeletonema_dohrnii-CCMP3373.AAC.3